MVMAPDQSKIIVGGVFTQISGAAEYGMAAIDPITGATLPWAANATVKDAGANAAIDTLSTDGTQHLRAAATSLGRAATWEGVFAADPSTGAIKWIERLPRRHLLHLLRRHRHVRSPAHQHYCDDVPNGFSQNNPWVLHRSQAFSTAVAGTLLHNTKVRTLTSAALLRPSSSTGTRRLTPGHVHRSDAGRVERHR